MRWRTIFSLGVIAVGGMALIPLYREGLFDPADRSREAAYGPLVGRPFLDGTLALRVVNGDRIDLRNSDAGATVVAFFSTTHEPSLAVLAGLDRLDDSFNIPSSRVNTLGICVDPGLTPAQVAAWAENHDLRFPVVHDPHGATARRFGVQQTPELFLLVGEGRLFHRGRPKGKIESDDRASGPAGLVTLSDHLDVLLSQASPGAPLPDFPPPAQPPTYTAEIEPILRRSCRDCHQPGQAAPFSLTTYTHAARRARDIADVVADRLMPPWKPATGFGPPLLHDRTLLPEEIALIRAWADSGAPEGASPAPEQPPATAPATTADGWKLGTPDLVLEMPEPFEIPASGPDLYRCFVLPTQFAEPRAITAIEVQPGNPRGVHHTFGYIDIRGLARSRDNDDPAPGYMCFSGFSGDSIFGALGGWTPGNEAHFLGEGIGLNLPPGADVVVQVHYHPSGKVEHDRTRLGLHFARKPIRQALQWVSACADPAEFVLPGDDPDIWWEAELKIPMDVELHAMTPHMHLLGKSMEARLVDPDGQVRPLIRIDDWDFNRQDTYYLREPLRLPEGTIVRLRARFDNSLANPRNPSRPPRLVRWGEGTTDDMMILFLGLTQAGQDLTVPGATDNFMEEFFRRAGIASESEAK